MDRARYGAFIVLSLAFIAITFFHSNAFRSKPAPRIDSRLQIAPQSPSSEISPSRPSALPGFPIDLNSATKEALMLLPGIGPKTAEKIIEKRIEMGGFRSVDELTEVKSIGKVRLGKIRKYAVVRPLSQIPDNAAPKR